MDKTYLVILVVAAVLAALVLLPVLKRRRAAPPQELSEWFSVTFDDERVTLHAAPPGREAWTQSFLWSEVTRVCFKCEGLSASDGIYVFTSQRPESFVIPTEARGGAEFWGRVVGRGLFPEEQFQRTLSLPEGGVLCWPEK